jgi:hypothetical protein
MRLAGWMTGVIGYFAGNAAMFRNSSVSVNDSTFIFN